MSADAFASALDSPAADAVRAGSPADVRAPLGGRDDATPRRLRATGAAAFDDDPLRLMRAARIAAELGLEITEDTRAIARRVAPRAGEPAGERQLAELRL